MASITMMNSSIHCKTTYNGQIRRFALDRTEFTSLKEAIAKLYSITEEFVLKYRDDESDYVILANQEELLTALTFSPILRISVESKNAPSTSSCDGYSKMYHKRHHSDRKEHWKHHHRHDDGENHPHHPHHWKHHHHDGERHHDWKGKQMKSTERREKKLAFINQCLADIGTDDSTLTPRSLLRKQKLLRKKQRIEFCIRGECFNQRKKQGLTTLEEEQFNITIKNQILAVKIEAMKVKARKREIKMLLQDNGEDKALLDELSSLKEQRKLFKNQKKALIDQLHI
jgi:Ni/Co efflux regulator RcnB